MYLDGEHGAFDVLMIDGTGILGAETPKGHDKETFALGFFYYGSSPWVQG